MTTTKEITVYEKNEKTYCEDCKPQGGRRLTLVLSSYDHFCQGCGEDFKELAEREELKGMSLIDACKAIQARYTPEEWERMAHTTAVTFSAEEITQAAYEQALTERSILFARKNMEQYEGEVPGLAELVEAKKSEMQVWNELQAVPAYVERKQS